MPRTIVYYIDSKSFGGAEQVLFTILKKLDRNTWHPVLAYHRSPGISSFIENAEAIGVHTITVPEIRSYYDFNNIFQFGKVLRSIRPAIFHANLNWPLSCSYGIFAAYFARVKIIIATQHLYSEIGWRRGRIEQKLISYPVNKYIAVSYDVARQLREIIVPENKIEVVHNGIILEDYNSRAYNVSGDDVYSSIRKNGETYPIVITVARLDKQKGHTYLLKAAADVPGTIFVFVGDGPEKANLENQARELSLADRVIFLGKRYDIPELLNGCDIFVLPSLYEGLPLSIMEAMAAGKPVVASDIGGVNELIRDGETGYLVPAGDTQALARSINTLVSDPALAGKIALAGKTLVEKEFSADSMVAGVTDIYTRQLL